MHFEFATAIGLEVRSKHNNYSAYGDYGVHTSASCWSPNINILRDPRWGRNQVGSIGFTTNHHLSSLHNYFLGSLYRHKENDF